MTRKTMIDCIAMSLEAWQKKPQGLDAETFADTVVGVVEGWPDRSGSRSGGMICERCGPVSEAECHQCAGKVTASEKVGILQEMVRLLNDQVLVLKDERDGFRQAVVELRERLAGAEEQLNEEAWE